ncbi:hypothetical protein RHSIM_Rhsim06G0144400 [Rhododendron simsii]|uniref:Uncharacterized protein n=1 Tax=Rhododendron simsii TaxID=118357 RepID=A0A834GUU5_RHOSS|nr:hypothetical protein RHSIM_Rhsim06G0144400 [Rhododendron simsii]
MGRKEVEGLPWEEAGKNREAAEEKGRKFWLRFYEMNSYSRCQRGCGSPKEGMEAYGEMEYGEKLIPSSSPPPSKLPRRQKLFSLQHFLSPKSAPSYVSSVLASKRNKQLKYFEWVLFEVVNRSFWCWDCMFYGTAGVYGVYGHIGFLLAQFPWPAEFWRAGCGCPCIASTNS